MIDVPLAAISLVGAALYVLLRISYVVFYSQFDVTPEEVGLGYVQVLTEAATGSALFIAVTVGELLLFRSVLRPAQQSGRVAISTLFASVGLIVVLGLSAARYAAQHVKHGRPLNPSGMLPLLFQPLNVLGLRVPRVTVLPVGKGTLPSTWCVTRPLMYLGSANGTSVFYDSKRKVTLRLPSAAVIIREKR
jgi:hypothetical protein